MKVLGFNLALLVVFGALGCGPVDDGLPKTVDARGVVLLDGDPIEGASIVALHENGTYYARAMSDSSGRFSLDAYESKPGAVPGNYKLTVSKTVTVDKAVNKIPRSLAEEAEHSAADGAEANVSWVNDLPRKYNSPITSGLAVSIPESGTDELKLELTLK
ncbi:MAG: carboxypeptidase regulatory-like domain-containing protein [Planctomycetales bacterium]|nr:carboxypeptidase regulatory-like domain-containing protein [Planctomycetales bacterium]